jgi:small subunit ribosomal protein S9
VINMAVQYYEGIGRRKTSTARVRVMNGSGNFVVNEKPVDVYFPRLGDIELILAPLETAGENRSNLDITVVVRGGGVTGQVDAVALGMARALIKMNPDLRPAMRKGGFLTRDPRIKERKKPGLKRARKAPTYTKR